MMIGACFLSFDDTGSTLTLPDGRGIRSVPHPTAEYEARARELGYADGAAMSREHDAIHVAIADVFETLSPVLVDIDASADKRRGFEEDLVKIVALRLNDPSADDKPGGGFVQWLRSILRPPR